MADDELTQTIALVFKQLGKKSVSRKDLELEISMKHHWFSPGNAHVLVDNALAANILVARDDGLLQPGFDTASIEIPVFFKPSETILKPPTPTPLFIRIVETIARETGTDKRAVISRINQLNDEKGLMIEVAALVYAYSRDIDISGFIEETDAELLARAQAQGT